MSLALPGYTDTGQTFTVQHTGSITLVQITEEISVSSSMPGDSFYEGACQAGYMDGWRLSGVLEGDSFPHYRKRVWVDGYTQTPIQVEFQEVTDPADRDKFSDTYDMSFQLGPLRLGVAYAEQSGGPRFPAYAKDYEATYAHFGDNDTQLITSLGPLSISWWLQSDGSFADTQDSPFTPIPYTIPAFPFSAQTRGKTSVEVALSDMTIGGDLIDTSDLLEGNLHGLGSGDVDAWGSLGATPFANYPWSLNYDLDIPTMSGASTGIEVDTVNIATVTMPHVATHSFRNVSWAASGLTAANEVLGINATDAAAQVVPWDIDDLFVELDLAPALSDPGSAGSYTPCTLELADVLNVLRPDGVTSPPSSFVASSGDIVVTEGGSSDTFVVTAPGSYVRREFGSSGTDLPEWRTWLGVGASGKADAGFSPDLSAKTKHTSGADVFDWSSFAYLRVVLSATATATPTLTVEGVQLDVTDTHVTGSDRETDFSVAETPYSVDYPLTLAIGANTLLIQLHFPDGETHPFYHGRIEALKLSGLPIGTFVLSDLSLVSCTDPATVGADEVFAKCAFRGQGVSDYDAWMASHNGAACTAATTDRDRTTEWFGNDGRGLRFVNPLTGSGTGTTLDSQLGLGDFWGFVDGLEGWSAVYSSAAYEAANQDSFGTALAPELAQWLDPQTPKTQTAGTAADWSARPRAGKINFVVGTPFMIRARSINGTGNLESLVVDDDGNRAPGGTSIDLIRDDTDAVVFTAATDAHGYVLFVGAPANGAFLLKLTGSAANTALPVRDQRRIDAVIPGDLFHVDLVELPGTPWLFRAYRTGASVSVERSVDEGHSWPDTTGIIGAFETGANAAVPTLAALRWDDLLCAAHDSGPNAQVWMSEDGGETFTLLRTVSGLRYPRLAVSELPWMAAHNGSRLEFRYSLDGGVTWTEETGLRITCPLHLCALRVDRRGWLQCIYADAGGALQHVASQDHAAWLSPVQIAAAGAYPAYALNTPAALVLFWNGSTLTVTRLESDYETVDTGLTAPTGSWKKGVMGAIGSHRDDFVIVGKITSLETRYSPDLGTNWPTPV